MNQTTHQQEGADEGITEDRPDFSKGELEQQVERAISRLEKKSKMLFEG